MALSDYELAVRLGQHLELFKVTSRAPFVASCRCPICGDSKKKSSKTRGYVYEHKSKFMYKCHNCGASYGLKYFAKLVNPALYEALLMEAYREKEAFNDTSSPRPAPKKKKLSLDDVFARVGDLPTHHPARKYLSARLIPETCWRDIWYSDNFKRDVCVHYAPGKYKHIAGPDERIVFPIRSVDGVSLIGLQGRALADDNPARYLTVSVVDDAALIFGAEHIDTKRPVYVTEGIFDALLLPNAISPLGLNHSIDIGKNIDLVWVIDNQPRHVDVVKQMNRLISEGKRVVIWPEDVTQKDPNEMVLAGKDVTKIVKNNTVQGISAKLRFSKWRKV